jgi:SAM-dependent methyltransferase
MDFAANAIRAELRLMWLWLRTVIVRSDEIECNICGWRGANFYPNVGNGYYEVETICPCCLCQDRHRSLAVILDRDTDLFEPKSTVVEVAPIRGFQQYCLNLKGNQNYISFDIARFAMERGDITEMRFANDSTDYFLCCHVLEHVPEDSKALREIHRILRPGGRAILQVPLDSEAEKTVEYAAPDLRETGHVRSYGKDFVKKITAHGFKVTCVSVLDCLTQHQIERYGLSTEPIFMAEKQ